MIPFELGTTSVYVEYIALALKRSGYLTTVTDTYDEAVRNAAIGFQRGSGLVPDGIVGDRTYGALLPYIEGFRRVVLSS